jgi:hypothetical protein
MAIGSEIIEKEPVVVFEQPVIPSINVKLTEPILTPVITPELSIVATASFELDQVPTVLGLALMVEPTQVAADEVLTTGSEFTVIEPEVVFEQPVTASVNVKFTEPEATPVIVPSLIIVARAVFELVQVPPVEGVAVIVEPTQA